MQAAGDRGKRGLLSDPSDFGFASGVAVGVSGVADSSRQWSLNFTGSSRMLL